MQKGQAPIPLNRKNVECGTRHSLMSPWGGFIDLNPLPSCHEWDKRDNADYSGLVCGRSSDAWLLS